MTPSTNLMQHTWKSLDQKTIKQQVVSLSSSPESQSYCIIFYMHAVVHICFIFYALKRLNIGLQQINRSSSSSYIFRIQHSLNIVFFFFNCIYYLFILSQNIMVLKQSKRQPTSSLTCFIFHQAPVLLLLTCCCEGNFGKTKQNKQTWLKTASFLECGRFGFLE